MAVVKLGSLALVDALIGTVAVLYLTVRLTLHALLTYFNYTSIIPSTLRHSSALLTSLGIIGSFRFNKAITAVN